MNKRLIRNDCSKYLKPYFRNIVNTLNYSNATNRNEHAFQLLFVPLESINHARSSEHHFFKQILKRLKKTVLLAFLVSFLPIVRHFGNIFVGCHCIRQS